MRVRPCCPKIVGPVAGLRIGPCVAGVASLSAAVGETVMSPLSAGAAAAPGVTAGPAADAVSVEGTRRSSSPGKIQ